MHIKKERERESKKEITKRRHMSHNSGSVDQIDRHSRGDLQKNIWLKEP